jgi:molybdopterin converting factor small subunit
MSVQPKKHPVEAGLITVRISFYSYFRDLTGCSTTTDTVSAGATLGDLFEKLSNRFPKLGSMRKSTLMAVGVDYQPPTYVLNADDEIALFPPVQGG